MMNDLKELLGREPYVPSSIVLTSGNEYRVTSPFQVALGESQLNYYHPRSDRWAVLRLSQVAAFDVAAERRCNGGRRTRRGR